MEGREQASRLCDVISVHRTAPHNIQVTTHPDGHDQNAGAIIDRPKPAFWSRIAKKRGAPLVKQGADFWKDLQKVSTWHGSWDKDKLELFVGGPQFLITLREASHSDPGRTKQDCV
jgi:hypothetical protein